MDCMIRCTSETDVYCPSCGSANIVGKNTPVSHCGQCGIFVAIEYVEKVEAVEESEKFVQLSLFEM